mmetsp:Transcript_118062/g.252208  ORF Transcript_118062/g.252208 Transcript_118062/m.252208 type:complete len:569 (-) Transcript_118062:68-1774(-)
MPTSSFALGVVFSILAAGWADEKSACTASGECEDASLLQAFSVPLYKRACDTETPAIGVLGLDGYYYPTQPGDIDDKRSFCEVFGVDGADYRCKSYEWCDGVPHFSVVKAMVRGGTWPVIQDGTWDCTVESGFRNATRQLLEDPNVCAIVGEAGFFSFYQGHVQDIQNELVEANASLTRKPMLLGSPSLAFAFGQSVDGDPIPSWGLLSSPETEKVMFVTSNFAKLGRSEIQRILDLETDEDIPMVRSGGKKSIDRKRLRDALVSKFKVKIMNYDGALEQTVHMLVELVAQFGLKWTVVNAQSFFTIGWNNVPGYGLPVVYGATFHNVFQSVYGGNGKQTFMLQMQHAFQNATALGFDIIAMIMESTEMPALTNNVRSLKNKPAWDVSTLVKCMMTAALKNDFNTHSSDITTAVYRSKTFQSCMMGWYNDPTRYEPMFGLQGDTARIKHYQDQNFTWEQLDQLMCTGGRPENPPEGSQPVGRLVSEFNTGDSTTVPEICQTTQLYCYCGGCANPCPGGGDCGGGSACGTHGENATSEGCIEMQQQTFDNYNASKCPETASASNVLVSF